MRAETIAPGTGLAQVGPERTRDAALLTGLCLAGLMIPLELTMIAVALPSLERDLGLGVFGGAWVIDAYMVAFASFVLAAGALADRFGRERVLLVGVLLFGATAALCGAAEDAWVLLIARAIQGVGAAIAVSAGLGVLANRFQSDVARFRAFGFFTSAIGVGMASGPTLGGALAASFGWRATFYVHAPIALVAAALVLLARSSDASEASKNRFDLGGGALAPEIERADVYAMCSPRRLGVEGLPPVPRLHVVRHAGMAR